MLLEQLKILQEGRNENVCRDLCTTVLWFVMFVAMVGAGMVIGFVLATFTWWQILIGTFIGTVIVTIHLLYPRKENDNKQRMG